MTISRGFDVAYSTYVNRKVIPRGVRINVYMSGVPKVSPDFQAIFDKVHSGMIVCTDIVSNTRMDIAKSKVRIVVDADDTEFSYEHEKNFFSFGVSEKRTDKTPFVRQTTLDEEWENLLGNDYKSRKKLSKKEKRRLKAEQAKNCVKKVKEPVKLNSFVE